MSDKPDERVIKSFVWHKERCFFVSTIERDSSAMLDSSRYNETLIWDFDWSAHKSKSLMYQWTAAEGAFTSISTCASNFSTLES